MNKLVAWWANRHIRAQERCAIYEADQRKYFRDHARYINGGLVQLPRSGDIIKIKAIRGITVDNTTLIIRDDILEYIIRAKTNAEAEMLRDNIVRDIDHIMRPAGGS